MSFISSFLYDCVYVVGSIPEEDSGNLYNTCSVFGPDGKLLVKHRKVSDSKKQL